MAVLPPTLLRKEHWLSLSWRMLVWIEAKAQTAPLITGASYRGQKPGPETGSRFISQASLSITGWWRLMEKSERLQRSESGRHIHFLFDHKFLFYCSYTLCGCFSIILSRDYSRKKLLAHTTNYFFLFAPLLPIFLMVRYFRMYQ